MYVLSVQNQHTQVPPDARALTFNNARAASRLFLPYPTRLAMRNRGFAGFHGNWRPVLFFDPRPHSHRPHHSSYHRVRLLFPRTQTRFLMLSSRRVVTESK
jgi:hypothetical protein